MTREYVIMNFINCFFTIRDHDHFLSHKDIILSFAKKPNLFFISNKFNISVLQVHNIVREYKLGRLNRNIIEISKEI